MSTDVSRVYLFLAQQTDGLLAADTNGDGTVIKSEFRTYMEDNFASWNGEEMSDSDLNDLVNTFWKKIDTNTSGKVSGTSYKNLNAIDSKELAAFNNKIAGYDVLNTFLSDNVSFPSSVLSSSYKTSWTSSISESLTSSLEYWLKSNSISSDDVAEENDNYKNLITELEAWYETASRKATADYCAMQTLDNSSLPSGYNYSDDSTLNNLIDSYIAENYGAQSDGSYLDISSVASGVEELVNAYLAIADGSADDDQLALLAEYGYSQTSSSPLNALQVATLSESLISAVSADSSLKEDYSNYADYFETAMTSYISSLTYSDYNTLKNTFSTLLTEFKNSEQYKNLEITIQTAEYFSDWTTGDTSFSQAIIDTLGDNYVENIQNRKEGDFNGAVDNMIEAAKTAAQDGEFTTNGAFDSSKLYSWVVDYIKENISDFYSGDMSIDDLNNRYSTLYSSVSTLDEVKEAAISYCEALCNKSTVLAEAVANVFGDDYATVINNMTSSAKVNTMITELMAKALEIGENAVYLSGTDELITNLQSSYGSTVCTPTYVVESDGTIRFVNYSVKGGAWDDETNDDLMEVFENIQNEIEENYASAISELGLSETEKNNLFNIALLTTLTDTSVVSSQYIETKLNGIIKSLVNNYAAMLEKISSDDTARKYITNVASSSLLNGRTTYNTSFISDGTTTRTYVTLAEYYTDNSTGGEDDWIYIYNTATTTYKASDGTSGTILKMNFTSGKDGTDSEKANSAMEALLDDYISNYSDYLSTAKIIELYKTAQKNAIKKLQSETKNNSATGSSYGYSESGGTTGCDDSVKESKTDGKAHVSVQSLLINIMSEMETLLAQEIMGL